MNLIEALTYGEDSFKKNAIESASLDSNILLRYVLQKPLEYILLNQELQLTCEQEEAYKNLVARRMNFEPIAYLVSSKEFYGRDFVLNNKVLIPRNDTELLIDIAKDHIGNATQILELGTGSGIIAITLALECVALRMVATDISSDALEVAMYNAKIYDVLNRIDFVQSNWFDELPDQKFDLIISNPPYVSTREIELMAKETILHEPALALFATNNGLASYSAIAKDAKNYLNPMGKILVEIGFEQKEYVEAIFVQNNYKLLEVFKDLSGNNRAMLFRYSSVT